MNYLWAGMILIGIIFGAFNGRMEVITNAALDSSKEAVTLCITMIGIMSFCCNMLLRFMFFRQIRKKKTDHRTHFFCRTSDERT